MGAGSPGLAKTDTYMRRCHRRRVRGRAADRRAGRMPIDWTRRLAAGGKRSEIVFCSPFPCEVRPMKLGRHQGRGRARLRMLLSRGSSF
jgi:hypothetical protein